MIRCKKTIAEKSRDKFKQYLTDSYVATCYSTVTLRFQLAIQQPNPKRAVHYGKEALSLSLENIDDEELGVINGKLGDWHAQIREFETACSYYQSSIKYLGSSPSYSRSLYISMMKFADLLLYRMNKYMDAEQILQQALQLVKNGGEVINVINTGVKLADAWVRQGRNAEALALLTESRKLLGTEESSKLDHMLVQQVYEWIDSKLELMQQQ